MTETMVSTLTQAEEAQLGQTVEMFEVITQSQPHDYQSLEILKEAYSKLGRASDAIATSKRIAQAYVELGQLSSAILEYETILQCCPDDPEVQEALKGIENQAASFEAVRGSGGNDTAIIQNPAVTIATPNQKPGLAPLPKEFDDGRRTMEKLFVDSKLIPPADFDATWEESSPVNNTSSLPLDPFILLLSKKDLVPLDRAIKLISDKSRAAHLSLAAYDIDIDMARTFPAEICRRWCILPFDRMSKSVFVATANPFNQQAAKELAEAMKSRLLWYLVPPAELVRTLRKVFR